MSKSRRAIEQELQRDEVAETVHSAVEWFKGNRMLLTVALVGVVLLAIAVSSYKGHREVVAHESNDMLSQTLEKFGKLMMATDAKPREDALKEVVTQADSLVEAHPGTTPALEALYLKGRAYYMMDKLPEARKAYEAFLAAARNDEEKAQGNIAVGYTFENDAFLHGSDQSRNTLEQAMNYYTRAVELAAGGNADQPKLPYLYNYGLLCQARVYEVIKQNPKAIELYQKVLKRPEPVPAEKAASETEGANPLLDMLRQQLNEQENQMSFQATAKLRLERLQAEAAAPPSTTATAIAPAPAAPAAPAAPVTTAAPAASVTPAVQATPAVPAPAQPAASAPAQPGALTPAQPAAVQATPSAPAQPAVAPVQAAPATVAAPTTGSAAK